MPKMMLDRRTLAQLFQNNQLAITVFERALGDVDAVLPSTIEEAHALAGQALAVAQTALASLSVLAEALAQLEGAPAVHLGTIAGQDADRVEIAGGAIDDTPIGQTAPSSASFTTVTASGQITSSAADVPPFVVESGALVETLYVARAAEADQALEAGHAVTTDKLTNPTTFPASATDLPTAIALVNSLRAAAISKGL